MVRPPHIVLPKSEWNRLQKQGSPSEQPSNDKRERLKALTKQCEDWIQTWPDTVAKHIAQLEKQKKTQHKDDIAFMKAYAQKLKQDNTAEAIKKARQLIFQDSNYGRKLLSALLESRALDVRDAQIKFRKNMQQKADEMAKEETSKKGDINDFRNNDSEREKLNKQKALECIEVNKEMVSLKKDKEMQTKLQEEKCAVEDEKLMKDILEIEKMKKEDIKRCEKEALEQYEADVKEIARIKAEEKKLDDALIEVQKKKQEIIKCKTQEVLKKIHQGRPNTKWSKDHYEKIDRIQREEKKRYDDFINKGIERYEERMAKKETRDKIKEKEKQTSRYSLAQQNKIAGDQQTLTKKCQNKCVCDRQCLTMKTPGKSAKKIGIKRDASPVTMIEIKSRQKSPKSPNSGDKDAEQKKPKVPYLRNRNKLIEDLRKREKVPTPWTGTKGLHVQFAQQADNVLKEIKHKHFARKVVDEYRKLNGLDAETLPVPNY